MTASAQEVLSWEAGQIGYEDNDGDRYWAIVPHHWYGAAWCAAFQQAANMKCDLPWIPGNYYCPSIEAYAKQSGDWYTNPHEAEPGDLVLYDFGYYGESVHIGRLERVLSSGALIQDIEGNTSSGNAGSQNNGRGVWRRVRGIGMVRGFVHLHMTQDAEGRHHSARDDGVLANGDRGKKVRNLQRHLNRRHHADLSVDGIFGGRTEAAVKDAQRHFNRNGADLRIDGEWGPNTRRADRWDHDFPMPKGHAYAMDDGTKWTHSGVRGHDSRKIKAIQDIVGVRQDGIFGRHTKNAVERWQRRHGLKADGQVGPATWRKMF